MTASRPGSADVTVASTVIRPILANSCARAATAAEARFRIDVPIAGRRAARVIALDDGAAGVLEEVVGMPWNGAHFFTLADGNGSARDSAGEAAGESAGASDLDDLLREIELHGIGGPDESLVDALHGADVAVMVATAGGNASAAAAIGYACFLDGIMTAGLILDDDDGQLAPTVTALRPHARVILVTSDAQDVAEVLIALRA
jgi:hypothetical protein